MTKAELKSIFLTAGNFQNYLLGTYVTMPSNGGGNPSIEAAMNKAAYDVIDAAIVAAQNLNNETYTVDEYPIGVQAQAEYWLINEIKANLSSNL